MQGIALVTGVLSWLDAATLEQSSKDRHLRSFPDI
jgi:hypothetical protein